MAKYHYTAKVDNNAEADDEGFVQVTCEITGKMAQFALGSHPEVKAGRIEWGACLFSDMSPERENYAREMLQIGGWI